MGMVRRVQDRLVAKSFCCSTPASTAYTGRKGNVCKMSLYWPKRATFQIWFKLYVCSYGFLFDIWGFSTLKHSCKSIKFFAVYHCWRKPETRKKSRQSKDALLILTVCCVPGSLRGVCQSGGWWAEGQACQAGLLGDRGTLSWDKFIWLSAVLTFNKFTNCGRARHVAKTLALAMAMGWRLDDGNAALAVEQSTCSQCSKNCNNSRGQQLLRLRVASSILARMPGHCQLLALLMRHINPGIRSSSHVQKGKQKRNNFPARAELLISFE